MGNIHHSNVKQEIMRVIMILDKEDYTESENFW